MIFPVDVINYILVGIMLGVGGTWVFLLKSMIDHYTMTPRLDGFKSSKDDNPKVSIILPARNEQGYIEKCLDSLIEQDYTNYEIVAIDDSSEDKTGEIIAKYAKQDSRVIYVKAKPKPDGWMGKNWACMEGYRKASGGLLLFTDADTTHKKNVISLAVDHLLSLKLDALTVAPKMLCMEFWTRITLPMISTFLHTRFSALRVNDPTKKTGYFFGSFFIIKKNVYDSVGAHEGVKQEIIEDGALGKKVKESGHKMRMVAGENFIEAIWARDLLTLWHGLKRMMVPLYLQMGGIAIGIFFAVLFLLFMPFAFLAYSAILFNTSLSFQVLFAASLAASGLIYAGAAIETKMMYLKLRYAILGPVGSFVIVLGFMSGLIHAKSNSAVSWRGRDYTMKDHAQKAINV